MPYKKEIAKKRKMPENIWKFLRDEHPDPGNDFDFFLLQEADIRELWDSSKGEVMPAWISRHPGTRPSLWWRFDASEPRQRIGGTGVPSHEILAVVPCFEFGLPTGWISEFEERHFPHLKGMSINSDDPPIFESEGAYLQRHNLLTDAEKKFVEKNPGLLGPESIIIEAVEKNIALDPSG